MGGLGLGGLDCPISDLIEVGRVVGKTGRRDRVPRRVPKTSSALTLSHFENG